MDDEHQMIKLTIQIEIAESNLTKHANDKKIKSLLF